MRMLLLSLMIFGIAVPAAQGGETTGAQYAAPLGLPVVLDNSGGAGISAGVQVQPATGSSSSGKRQSGGKRLVPAASFSDGFPDRSPGSGDPGIGTGLWVPPNTAGRLVADQSGNAAWTTTYAPGCLNGLTASNSSSGCAAQTSFNGFSLGSGRTLVLRYKSTPTAGASLKYIRTRSYDGGNVGVNMRVWLSASPTATYETVATACKQTSARTPMVITGPGYCPIAPNTVYYYGMDYNEPHSLRFTVEERGADFL